MLKRYIKTRISNFVTRIATEVSRDVANQVSRDVANQVSQEVSRDVANQVSSEILNKRLESFQSDIEANKQLSLLIRNNVINYIQNTKKINDTFDFDSFIKTYNNPRVIGNLDKWHIEQRNNNLPILFGNTTNFNTLENASDNLPDADVVYLWGFWDFYKVLPIITLSNKIPLFYIEDGFLKSILTSPVIGECIFHSGISFTVDDLTFYFDATRPSRLEMMLNSEELVISDEQKLRAQNLIQLIVENHLSKYNHQPIKDIEIGEKGKQKILVIDQTVGDYSITKGLANNDTFNQMLESAIKDNPNADIIIKTHPDTIAKNDKSTGYYSNLESTDSVYVFTENINPISLLKLVDKVYVCTSQMGFEALMCGKEVHVFGMPFYAGWGLTVDKQQCARRIKKRTLEEVFYIVYIMYSKYVNPNNKNRCEIEEAIFSLLKLREEYFILNQKKDLK